MAGSRCRSATTLLTRAVLGGLFLGAARLAGEPVAAAPPAELQHVAVSSAPIAAFAPQAGFDRHDPSNVIRWNDRFWVYYTHNVDNHRAVTIHLGTSVDGRDWRDLGLTFAGGPDGTWDHSGAIAPYVVVHDGTFHLYYTGFRNGDLATRDLGVATATSPQGPWVRDPGGPILRRSADPAAWDSGMLGDSNVVQHHGRWWLYFKSRRTDETNRQTRIGVATADTPTGPFRREDRNPLFAGHAFTAWPHGGGIAAVCGVVSPQLLWSADGLDFENAGTLPTESTGLFTPADGGDPARRWGIEAFAAEVDGRPARGLRRFDWTFGR